MMAPLRWLRLVWRLDISRIERGCDREFMSFLQRSGTRASRRCRPAVILTAVGPLPAGRQQPGTAGTAVFHYVNLRWDKGPQLSRKGFCIKPRKGLEIDDCIKLPQKL